MNLKTSDYQNKSEDTKEMQQLRSTALSRYHTQVTRGTNIDKKKKKKKKKKRHIWNHRHTNKNELQHRNCLDMFSRSISLGVWQVLFKKKNNK